jgi:hypothetical protein
MRAMIITAVVLALAQSLIPIAENRLIIFGSDQWGDIFATKLILSQGNFSSAAMYMGGYYGSIPFFCLLDAIVSLTIGNVFLSYAVLAGIMGLAMVLSIYLILFKLTESIIASVVGFFVFLSTPRVSTVEAIPSTLGLVLGSILVLILIDYISLPRRRTLVVFLLAALSALFLYPTPVIVIILLCGGLVAAYFLSKKQTYPQVRMARNLTVLVCVLSFAYWCLTNGDLLASMITPLRVLLASLSTYTGTTVYTPNYYGSGFESVSFAWALPAGFSAAYVAATLYEMLKKKRSHATDKEKLSLFPSVTSVIGLLMLGVAFISIVHAPSASVERYADTGAYLLLVFPSAIVGSQIIGSKRKLACIGVIFMLGVSVYVGSSSPDWAPSENPTFAAINYTYTGYVEANTIVTFLPNNLMIYFDHDIPLVGVARMANISSSTPPSFQTTRNILESIKNAAFNPLAGSRYPIEIFVIKTDEIQNTTIIDEYMNILYNSGMHIMLANPYGYTGT